MKRFSIAILVGLVALAAGCGSKRVEHLQEAYFEDRIPLHESMRPGGPATELKLTVAGTDGLKVTTWGFDSDQPPETIVTFYEKILTRVEKKTEANGDTVLSYQPTGSEPVGNEHEGVIVTVRKPRKGTGGSYIEVQERLLPTRDKKDKEKKKAE